MTLVLGHTSYDRCRGAVASAADRLAADRERIDTRVTGLLGAGWRGRAATSFADAWDDWVRAADDVRDALSTMATLLDVVHHDTAARDDAAAGALGRLTDRLG